MTYDSFIQANPDNTNGTERNETKLSSVLEVHIRILCMNQNNEEKKEDIWI